MVLALTSLAFLLSYASMPSFTNWMTQYNKSYGSINEYVHRKNIYSSNILKIAKHNSIENSWKMNLNKFADMTSSEFKSYVGSCYNYSLRNNTNDGDYLEKFGIELPVSVNWTAKGAVTPVKTKDNVDHVGHSQQQDQLKVHIFYLLLNLNLYLNNNWLIVLNQKVIKGAMVVLWITGFNILLTIKVFLVRVIIHILLLMVHVLIIKLLIWYRE